MYKIKISPFYVRRSKRICKTVFITALLVLNPQTYHQRFNGCLSPAHWLLSKKTFPPKKKHPNPYFSFLPPIINKNPPFFYCAINAVAYVIVLGLRQL